MDDPRPTLNAALKEAMVHKDVMRRDVLRMALNAIKQVEIDERKSLAPEEALAVLQKEAKKRRESIAEAQAAGRADVAGEEQAQLAILEEFLPRQMSRDHVEQLARAAIAQTGAQSAKDMGKVMAALLPQVKGQADGKLVSDVVRQLLSS